MPLGCSHAQSRVKLILIASTSKINISGHPTGASGIEFHYKGPDISYLLNTEEERKLTAILYEMLRSGRITSSLLDKIANKLEETSKRIS